MRNNVDWPSEQVTLTLTLSLNLFATSIPQITFRIPHSENYHRPYTTAHGEHSSMGLYVLGNHEMNNAKTAETAKTRIIGPIPESSNSSIQSMIRVNTEIDWLVPVNTQRA